jgi:hypothetical protein
MGSHTLRGGCSARLDVVPLLAVLPRRGYVPDF